jgi:nucleotidyltransferase/DNA polymerase involved in DNA repair
MESIKGFGAGTGTKVSGTGRNLPEDINDTAYLEKLIAQFAAELCRKLRQAGSRLPASPLSCAIVILKPSPAVKLYIPAIPI